MVIGSFGEKGYDFESVQWVRLFDGRYGEAKTLMERLHSENIPTRFTVFGNQEGSAVVGVDVMRRWVAPARKLMENEP